MTTIRATAAEPAWHRRQRRSRTRGCTVLNNFVTGQEVSATAVQSALHALDGHHSASTLVQSMQTPASSPWCKRCRQWVARCGKPAVWAARTQASKAAPHPPTGLGLHGQFAVARSALARLGGLLGAAQAAFTATGSQAARSQPWSRTRQSTSWWWTAPAGVAGPTEFGSPASATNYATINWTADSHDGIEQQFGRSQALGGIGCPLEGCRWFAECFERSTQGLDKQECAGGSEEAPCHRHSTVQGQTGPLEAGHGENQLRESLGGISRADHGHDRLADRRARGGIEALRRAKGHMGDAVTGSFAEPVTGGSDDLGGRRGRGHGRYQQGTGGRRQPKNRGPKSDDFGKAADACGSLAKSQSGCERHPTRWLEDAASRNQRQQGQGKICQGWGRKDAPSISPGPSLLGPPGLELCHGPEHGTERTTADFDFVGNWTRYCVHHDTLGWGHSVTRCHNFTSTWMARFQAVQLGAAVKGWSFAKWHDERIAPEDSLEIRSSWLLGGESGPCATPDGTGCAEPAADLTSHSLGESVSGGGELQRAMVALTELAGFAVT